MTQPAECPTVCTTEEKVPWLVYGLAGGALLGGMGVALYVWAKERAEEEALKAEASAAEIDRRASGGKLYEPPELSRWSGKPATYRRG